MKKSTKTIAGVLIGLAAASVMGVGFSAWIINQTSTVEKTGITVAVADTTDKSILITSSAVDDGAIRFDADRDDVTPPIVYGAESGGGEDLEFVISYHVELAPQVVSGGVKVTLAFDNDGTPSAAQSAYSASESSNRFIAPLAIGGEHNAVVAASGPASLAKSDKTQEINSSTEDLITSVVTAGTAVTTGYTAYDVVTTFSYHWGSAFNYLNPSIYATDSNLSTVVSALAALQQASEAALKVTLTSYTA